MSVINRMLQDLEARRAGSAQAPPAVRATPARNDRKRLLFWMAGGVAAAATLAFGDWPQLLSSQAARAPQAVAIVEAGVPAGPQTRGNAEKPGALVAAAASATAAPPAADTATATAAVAVAAAPVAAPAAPAPPAAVSRQRTPTQVAPLGAETSVRLPKTVTEPLMLASASYGLEPTLRSSAAALLAPAQKGVAAPADPASVLGPALAPAPVRNEAPGRVDKQMSAQSPAQRAQLLYQQGMEMMSTGHGRMALERLQQALVIQPTLMAARVQAVTLLGEHGQHAEAEALARDGLALAPGEAQLSYLLARSLAGQGDAPGALAVLDRSASPGPDAFGLRAGLLSQQGDFRRASADYEKAVRLQPGNSLWWLGLGVALEAQGQPQQARRVYARAQSLGMDSHDLNVFLDQKLAALK